MDRGAAAVTKTSRFPPPFPLKARSLYLPSHTSDDVRQATVSRRVARLTECPLCASTATTRARCSTRSPRHDASPWTAAGRCWWRPCRTAAGTTRRRTTRPGAHAQACVGKVWKEGVNQAM
eukprot:152632-Chlamydomonas_euryale.AAC.4